MRILLIEDDEILTDVLVRSLTEQYYVVDVVEDGQMGWEYAQSAEYDLIIMDVGLPKLDGISLCQRLRSQNYPIPILLITAKDATSDRIRGLDAGADDYLIKPLNLEELHARVRALLRRGEVTPATILELAGLKLDPTSCQVFYQEKLLKLTPKEYALLELFLRNPRRLFSRSYMIEHLWTFEDVPSEESVKAHVKGLRQKLKQAGAVDWIENVYGMGYRLNPEILEKPPSPQVKSSETATKTTNQEQFQQAAAVLWQQYQGLMVQRLQILKKAAGAVQSQTLTQDLSQSAQQAAHKLAGVLGMFGKDEGTAVARSIEEILQTSSSKALLKLPSLVEQLDELLNLSNLEPTIPPTETISTPKGGISANPKVLFLDSNSELLVSLQQLTQSVQVQWHYFDNLAQTQSWLRDNTPDLLILNREGAQDWDKCLALITELAHRTPRIPSLILTTITDLKQRVAIAQAGGRRILVKPVTPEQIWETAGQLLQARLAQSVKVLAVDDDIIFLAALRPLLEPWGMQVTLLANPRDFWQTLESVQPDLLILDVEMPQLNGITLCQAVRTAPQWQELPILFVTSHSDRSTIEQIFAAGADDYITKPLVGAELLTRLSNRLDRTRLLQTLATKDPVTGLVNQPQSQRILTDLMTEAARAQTQLTFIVVRAINLDAIHVQYGHSLGNQILQQWGRLLSAGLQSAEMVAYWGNGEFAIAMLGLGKVEAEACLKESITLLGQQLWQTTTGECFQIGVDWGIAEYPTDGLTIPSLYQSIRTQQG